MKNHYDTEELLILFSKGTTRPKIVFSTKLILFSESYYIFYTNVRNFKSRKSVIILWIFWQYHAFLLNGIIKFQISQGVMNLICRWVKMLSKSPRKYTKYKKVENTRLSLTIFEISAITQCLSRKTNGLFSKIFAWKFLLAKNQ